MPYQERRSTQSNGSSFIKYDRLDSKEVIPGDVDNIREKDKPIIDPTKLKTMQLIQIIKRIVSKPK